MMLVLFSLLFSSVFASDLIRNTGRVILHRKIWPNPPANTLGSVVDPGFVRVQAWDEGKIYKPNNVSAMKAEATEWFLSQFNIDLAAGVPGYYAASIVTPEGTAYPFTNGDNLMYRKVFDDTKPSTGILNDTFILDTGYIMVMSKDGNFTGGTAAGTPYFKGDLIWYTKYGYLNQREIGSPSEHRTLEIINVRAYAPGKVIAGPYGSDLYMKTQVVDEAGKVGFGTISTVYGLENGVITQRTHTYLEWE